MVFTVSDFYHLHEGDLALVAGSGGLTRPVDSVGILDYELMPGLKNKYQRVNFYEGQLVLSTFLYSHDDPYYISEAVRYLVGRGTSGLVIKNVFHLQVPETALRFANARNYPVFVTAADGFFFDEVVVDVARRVERLSLAAEVERLVDRLMVEADDPGRDPARTRELARDLNPSFQGECLVAWVPTGDGLPAGTFPEVERAFQKSELFGVGNVLLPYRGGVMLIVSWDPEEDVDPEAILRTIREDLPLGGERALVGMSARHQTTDELPEALVEARLAARVAELRGEPAVRYDRLGTLSVLLGCATSPAARAFEQRVLDPLRTHDAEANAHLEETLRAYLEADCSATEAGRRRGQHPNTVRYRLGRMSALTGLSCRVPSQLDQLRMAEQLAFCREVLAGA